MNKFYLFLSSVLLSGLLVSCGNSTKDNECKYHIDLDGDGLCENCHQSINPTPTPTPDPTPEIETITRIKATGSFTKKHYAINDSWDSSGVSVYAVTNKGAESLLATSEYLVAYNPSIPNLYAGTLSVTFTLKNKSSCEAMLNFTDLSVDSETYDFESEKTSYYKNADLTLSSQSLRNELHRHLCLNHTKLVSYGEVNSYRTRTANYDSMDVVPNKSLNEMFYTGKQCKMGEGTREHVWPASLSSSLWPHTDLDDSYKGGGSDLFHIRSSSSEINEKRGNAPFGELSNHSKYISDGGPYKLYGSGNNSYGQFTTIEVEDEMKGDVARIIAYVFVHYKKHTTTPSSFTSYTSSSLSIQNVMSFSSESNCFKKLIEWNKLDPVSEVEKFRNHTVQKIQGNRNPFVDYPDLMEKAFK